MSGDADLPDDESNAAVSTETVQRRHLLKWLVGGVGAVVVVGATGFELVNHGVLPGKQTLDEIDGGCSVPATPLFFRSGGRNESGRFYSKARRQSVGYTIGYPSGYQSGDALALIVMLHGFGQTHATALVGMTPAQAVAIVVNDTALAPMALVTVDGGDGYWNPHPGDNPMAMVVDELIPLCQRKGLGVSPKKIGLMGISMGGYGALNIAERYAGVASAVAAISPAVWTTYEQANAVDAGAFASPKTFHEGDVIRNASALKDLSVRIASGDDDPFHPGVQKLVRALPRGSIDVFAKGCHTNSFFLEQEPPSMMFLSRHLT
jgi:enterochelin esterase-like enzyme